MNSSKSIIFTITSLVILLSSCKINFSSNKLPSPLPIEKEKEPTATFLSTGTPEVSESPINNEWWKDTVFYEIFVRSFYDSNGDGIGDFQGIIQKLNYLNDGDPSTSSDLGISGIWLMPIMPSPSTHGYDVTDYYNVNPQYGTLEDFKELLDQAHLRGIKVILDLPINHTSSDHPWFIQSQDQQSPFRNWYIWKETDPGYLGPWNQIVWHPMNGDYFYGYFWEGMPDLNYRNPKVTAEMENVVRFWVEDIGVDGFRLDAIGALIEDGNQQVETSATHQWFKEFNQFVKELNADIFTVGEVWNPNEIVVPYLKNHEVDLAFNFDLSAAIIRGINENNPAIIIEQVQKGKDLFPDGRYGAFITNHDMERAITQLGENQEKAKIGASIYLTLPGVPFIYYGEEIGMGGLAPDEQCRLPMQWDASQNAGFSSSVPWLPPQPNFRDLNVLTEEEEPTSIIIQYKNLIALRNREELFENGNIFINQSEDPRIYSISLAHQGKAILVIINISDQAINKFAISQQARIFTQVRQFVTDLYGNSSPAMLEVDASGGFQDYQPVDQIPAFGTLIYRIEPGTP
jgi:alpha-amylase